MSKCGGMRRAHAAQPPAGGGAFSAIEKMMQWAWGAGSILRKPAAHAAMHAHACTCMLRQGSGSAALPAAGKGRRGCCRPQTTLAHSPPTLLPNLWPPSVMPVVSGATIWAEQAEHATSIRAAAARRRAIAADWRGGRQRKRGEWMCMLRRGLLSAPPIRRVPSASRGTLAPGRHALRRPPHHRSDACAAG